MAALRAGSKALIREINEALVLDVVRGGGAVSRGAIAAATGLSAATVTGIANAMLESALLVETDVVQGPRGRPARLLELGPGVVAAGVRIGTDHVFAVLSTLRGEVVASHREPLAGLDPPVVVDVVADAVRKVSALQSASALVGAGVAVSGVVDHDEGAVLHSGSLGWNGVPLGALLAERLDLPVVVDSYVNCVAQRSLLFSEAVGQDLLVFSLGLSLGASVIIDGKIYRGFEGAAGGFAHSRLPGRGEPRPCHCGASDCIESWGSRWGIDRELERRGIHGGVGSDRAREVLVESASQLAVAMANATKILGAERIVLAIAPDLDVPLLREQLLPKIDGEFAHLRTPTPTVSIELTDQLAVATGASYVMLAELFTPNGVSRRPA